MSFRMPHEDVLVLLVLFGFGSVSPSPSSAGVSSTFRLGFFGRLFALALAFGSAAGGGGAVFFKSVLKVMDGLSQKFIGS